jgi:hypothetical protein
MKHIKQLFAATILIFTLSVAALAGDMHTPSLVAPPPPPPPLDPQTPKMVANTAAITYDALTEAALLFCRKMLSIF